jgi:beta-lactamase class A
MPSDRIIGDLMKGGCEPILRWVQRLCLVAFPLLIAVALSVPVAAQEQHLRILSEKLDARLTEIAQEAPGVMGIAVVDLTSDERVGVNETLVFPQGSAIKIPVLLELYRQAEAGALRLDERVQVSAADQVGGSGVLRSFGDGTSQVSLRDLAVLMINLSDNTATNLLIDRVGMENVNRTMQEIDLGNTKLQRRMIRPEDSARGNENLSTPAEAAQLMARIAHCELPINPAHCADLRSILEIPKSGSLADPIPSGVPVAWKPGGITGVSTAWGIVGLEGRPYAIAAMVNYSDGGAAGEAIRRASEATYEHFSRLAGATPYGTRVPVRYLPQVPRW